MIHNVKILNNIMYIMGKQCITVFFIVLLLILCVYNISYIKYAIQAILNCCSLLKCDDSVTGGGMQNIDTFFTTKKPKNVIIVDVANFYSYWYKQKYNKKFHYNDQTELFNFYLKAMEEHYNIYGKENTCHYVLKNFKILKDNKMLASFINTDTIEIFKKFCCDRNIIISIAQDYRGVVSKLWNSDKYHYVKGRDDYLCFYIAQYYKKKYIRAQILSNDSFKDFTTFGFVPEFIALHINCTHTKEQKIKPKPNALGQLRDYTIIKNDKLFSHLKKK
jgi:hypothetical protein